MYSTQFNYERVTLLLKIRGGRVETKLIISIFAKYDISLSLTKFSELYHENDPNIITMFLKLSRKSPQNIFAKKLKFRKKQLFFQAAARISSCQEFREKFRNLRTFLHAIFSKIRKRENQSFSFNPT
jgi:hypothetical protein